MSLDKANNDDWNWVKAKDFMIFNPRESVKKGTTIKNVPMDKIEPKTKEISSYEITNFKGGVKFRNGDTLMARITPCLENGKISQVSILDYNEIGAGSTEFIVLREKEGVSDKDFIYYLSNSEFFKEPAIKSMVGSSGRQRVQRDVVENLEIYVPPLDTQKKIGKLLSYFDDKISLNKKINKNLEELLKLIFYQWFESKINSYLPYNWEIVELHEVASFSQGVQVPIKEQIEEYKKGYIRFIRIIDITQQNENDIRYIKNRDKGHITENEIFMVRYGTPGILSRNYNGIIANNMFKISPLKKVTSNYLFSALNVKRIQKFIKGNSTSSTMPAITFSTLNNLELIIPDSEIMKKFDNISEKIRLKQLNLLNENKKLTQLRDTLLPKLMSGEIDVSKINCDL